MRRARAGAVALSLALIASACSIEGEDYGGDAATGRQPATEAATVATTVAPTTAPPTTVPPTTVPPTTLAPTTTTTATTVPAQEETTVQGGPGVDHEELMAALTPLIAAEDAMHEFEARWDEGMTYSETFQGWREVRAMVDEAFADFEFPADASADQLAAGQVYVDAVLGAQVEWQNVTDFIVTYITNYTPEVLILNAYSKAEFRLRDAIAALEALEAMGTA